MTEHDPLDTTVALRRIIAGEDLSRGEMRSMMGSLMDGELVEIEKAALLVALATKGETADEIAGAAEAMRERCVPVEHSVKGVVDTCGTGGDGKGTFNISTAGICFMFAPVFHPAMREVMPVRRALGVRTLFNVVGPLTNPAGVTRQVMGVYSQPLVVVIARVLRDLGAEHAIVVHGCDGLDELTTTGGTHVAEVENGEIEIHDVRPPDFGLEAVAPEALRGGEPEENARILEAILGGEPGPLADVTALNAGAAIYVGGRAESLREGVKLALEVLASGAAVRTLDGLRNVSRQRDADPDNGI
jgi:anthranilate phosphoribosyltransferase